VSVVNNQCHLEYLVQGEVIPNTVSNPIPALSQSSPTAEVPLTVNPTINLHAMPPHQPQTTTNVTESIQAPPSDQ
jgi:hypothetical protein